MTCTIIVGGQFGSEGKGKVVALEAASLPSPWVVRCGGPNSGHSVSLNGRTLTLRQIPAGVYNPNSRLFLAAGCAVDIDVLASEVADLGLSRDQVTIDPRAVLINAEDKESETAIVQRIGSTGSGTGAAVARRLQRLDVELAENSDRLRSYVQVRPVAPLLHQHLASGGDVIVEGTQGFGLSLLHSPLYPNVTSRDTTAAGFISEVGLSPLCVTQVIVVFRTFPIRVGGASGPLSDEISWEDVAVRSNAPTVVPEYTSVTRRLRRVGLFDQEMAAMAVSYNRPTSLAIMGLDRLDYRASGVRSAAHLPATARQFINGLSQRTATKVSWVGTGFETDAAFLYEGRS